MLTKEYVLEVIKEVSGQESIDIDTNLLQVGLDSTIILEILIEFEVQYELDVLDEMLDLNQFVTPLDIYNYIGKLI